MYAHDVRVALALIEELIPIPEVLTHFMRLHGRAQRIL
jgi:hypothetical protein